jgi:PAS domain S-box-containing protein
MDRLFDLTDVIEQISDCIGIFSITGECRYANRALAEFLNLQNPHDVTGLNFREMLRDAVILDNVFSALLQGKPWYGPAQVTVGKADQRLEFAVAFPLGEKSNEFITCFRSVRGKPFETELWDKLRDSEERYRTLVELSPNLIQIHVNGIITFINSSGVRMLRGSSAEEFIGQPIYKYIHPKEHPLVAERVAHEIGKQEKMGPVEERWIRTDGSEFDVEIVALPFEYRGQVAVQVIAIDITEKKRSLEKLNQYTRQLLAFNAISLALVSSLNTDEILRQVSYRLTDVLQASSLAILMKQQQDFVVVASVGEGAESMLARRVSCSSLEEYTSATLSGSGMIAGQAVHSYPLLPSNSLSSILIEKVMLNNDLLGMIQAAYPTSTIDLSAEQGILHLVSTWVSVALQNARLYQNEQRQHQYAEALLESANAINSNLHLSQVLERILQQVWRVIPCSAANIMVMEGDEARLVCGIGYDHIGIRKEWLKTVHYPINRMIHLRRMLDDHRPVIIHNTGLDSDWVTIEKSEWVRSYAAAPLIIKGQVFGFLNLDSDEIGHFGDDIVERLQAFAAQASIAIQNARLIEDLQYSLRHEQAIRTQLVQSEKLAGMGRMVASVAHELNNPLQTIQNCLYILQQEVDFRPDMTEHLNTGLSEVRRLAGIVERIRKFYRPSVQSERELVNPVEILQNVHSFLKFHLNQKRITWILSGQKDCLITTHIDSLQQVFINLAQNAIDSMQPNGGTLTIDITKHPDGSMIGISFQDTGRGIPPENLPNIFDPFFTTREMGFGLGLPICRDIVESHGGFIQVHSSPGSGSNFCVWLPVTIVTGGE